MLKRKDRLGEKVHRVHRWAGHCPAIRELFLKIIPKKSQNCHFFKKMTKSSKMAKIGGGPKMGPKITISGARAGLSILFLAIWQVNQPLIRGSPPLGGVPPGSKNEALFLVHYDKIYDQGIILKLFPRLMAMTRPPIDPTSDRTC